MTPEEKALIDARREDFAAGWRALRRQDVHGLTSLRDWDDANAAAAEAFPYPPEPPELPTFTDADGYAWRVNGGVIEFASHDGTQWGLYADWLNPALIRGLYALLPPSTEDAR